MSKYKQLNIWEVLPKLSQQIKCQPFCHMLLLWAKTSWLQSDVIIKFKSAHVGGILKNMLQSISKDQCYQTIQPLIKDLMKDDNQEVRKG